MSLKIFLCHASEDKPIVREIYNKLRSDGFEPWLDVEDLLPGQDWQLEIPKAVKNSDLVLVCLSANAVTKTGYVHKEIKFALDAADERPEGTLYLIPLRLEECDIPNRLSKWHWVNYFDSDGYGKLLRALEAKLRKQYDDSFALQAKHLNIMVTGGRDITPKISDLAFFVGEQLAKRGHTLMSNGSRGVDKASAEGALSICRRHNFDVNSKIRVIRPRQYPVPEFDFGDLQIIGEDYSERRDYVIHRSDVVILVGGSRGTEKVARHSQIVRTPIVPIGIGEKKVGAVKYWYQMKEKRKEFPGTISPDDNDLLNIGPDNHDLLEVAYSAVIIAEKLCSTK